MYGLWMSDFSVIFFLQVKESLLLTPVGGFFQKHWFIQKDESFMLASGVKCFIYEQNKWMKQQTEKRWGNIWVEYIFSDLHSILVRCNYVPAEFASTAECCL